MGIDKFYRNVGIGLRRIFQIFVKKPIRNFNIENRSFKAIEKPKVAPWHESTQKVIKELKKDSNFEQYNKFDKVLAKNLQSVKVNSDDPLEFPKKETNRKLPKERSGAGVPYSLNYTDTVPIGKITLISALNMLIENRKFNVPVHEIASKYKIEEEDVENILKYVDIYKVINKENKKSDLYSLISDPGMFPKLEKIPESEKKLNEA